MQRTLTVLEDIQRDQNEFDVQRLLTQLRDLYTQNPEGDAVPNALLELFSALSQSRTNGYTPSRLTILESIGGAQHSGEVLKEKIEAIVQNAPLPKVVADKLTEIIKDRKQFLQEVSKSVDGLHALGITEDLGTSDKEGEVGIRIPSSMTQNELPAVAAQLEEWNDFIKVLHDLCNEGARDAKISSVSNGSIWLFFQEPLHCLALLAFIINQLASAAKKIQEIQMNIESLKKEGLPDDVFQKLAEFELEKSKKSIDAVVDEIFATQDINQYPNGDGEEAKLKLHRVVNDLAKSMQKGLAVEINPPKPPADLQAEEKDDEKLKKQKLINERIATVKGVLGITVDIAKGAIDFSKVFLLADQSGSDISSVDDQSLDPKTSIDDVGGTNDNVA